MDLNPAASLRSPVARSILRSVRRVWGATEAAGGTTDSICGGRRLGGVSYKLGKRAAGGFPLGGVSYELERYPMGRFALRIAYQSQVVGPRGFLRLSWFGFSQRSSRRICAISVKTAYSRRWDTEWAGILRIRYGRAPDEWGTLWIARVRLLGGYLVGGASYDFA